MEARQADQSRGHCRYLTLPSLSAIFSISPTHLLLFEITHCSDPHFTSLPLLHFTAIPQPVLPIDRDSNASAWILTVSNGSVAADDDAGSS